MNCDKILGSKYKYMYHVVTKLPHTRKLSDSDLDIPTSQVLCTSKHIPHRNAHGTTKDTPQSAARYLTRTFYFPYSVWFGCTGLCYLNISCLWGEARSAQGQEVATAVHDGACATAFLGSW